MRERLDLSPLAQACTTIANEVADESGFVQMRKLLDRFDASLIIRPLLVEGMLATITQPTQSAEESNSWAVLVDSEKYSVTEENVSNETAEHPLPVRMRFTIAHELAHSLVFRPTHFGIKLQLPTQSKKSRADFVKEIERETDKLSSLLLWPERAVEAFLDTESLSIDKLARLALKQGISRQVCLSRLRAFQRKDKRGLLFRDGLKNFGAGVGEWVQGGRAVLHKWPLFLNFDRNIIPEAFLKVAQQDRLPAQSVFNDGNFILCGGSVSHTEFVSAAGLPTTPDAERMPILVSVEKTNRKVGSSFLYMICRQAENSHLKPAVVQKQLWDNDKAH